MKKSNMAATYTRKSFNLSQKIEFSIEFFILTACTSVYKPLSFRQMVSIKQPTSIVHSNNHRSHTHPNFKFKFTKLDKSHSIGEIGAFRTALNQEMDSTQSHGEENVWNALWHATIAYLNLPTTTIRSQHG